MYLYQKFGEFGLNSDNSYHIVVVVVVTTLENQLNKIKHVRSAEKGPVNKVANFDIKMKKIITI